MSSLGNMWTNPITRNRRISSPGTTALPTPSPRSVHTASNSGPMGPESAGKNSTSSSFSTSSAASSSLSSSSSSLASAFPVTPEEERHRRFAAAVAAAAATTAPRRTCRTEHHGDQNSSTLANAEAEVVIAVVSPPRPRPSTTPRTPPPSYSPLQSVPPSSVPPSPVELDADLLYASSLPMMLEDLPPPALPVLQSSSGSEDEGFGSADDESSLLKLQALTMAPIVPPCPRGRPSLTITTGTAAAAPPASRNRISVGSRTRSLPVGGLVGGGSGNKKRPSLSHFSYGAAAVAVLPSPSAAPPPPPRLGRSRGGSGGASVGGSASNCRGRGGGRGWKQEDREKDGAVVVVAAAAGAGGGGPPRRSTSTSSRGSSVGSRYFRDSRLETTLGLIRSGQMFCEERHITADFVRRADVPRSNEQTTESGLVRHALLITDAALYMLEVEMLPRPKPPGVATPPPPPPPPPPSPPPPPPTSQTYSTAPAAGMGDGEARRADSLERLSSHMIDLGIGHEAAQAVAPAAPWTPTGGLSTGSGQADRPPKSGSGGGGGTAGGGGRGDSQIIQARGGEKAKVKSIKMIDRLEPPELSHVSLPFKEVTLRNGDVMARKGCGIVLHTKVEGRVDHVWLKCRSNQDRGALVDALVRWHESWTPELPELNVQQARVPETTLSAHLSRVTRAQSGSSIRRKDTDCIIS